MAGHVALYRKYRSKKLADVIGQKHITETLARAVKNGQISHAYLFTGPHGVGKTSVARILAYLINNIEYTNDNSSQLDIIEIDAASNRRIDEVRELRDTINIAPTSLKYKVYIIDEVHMLTKEAFNALLKTLEEPPAHAVFILATTEAHKLPATILSRTQRHNFRPISQNELTDHILEVCKSENIIIDKKAAQLIAKHANGSARDALSLLDQVRHTSDDIKDSVVEEIIGIAPKEMIESLLNAAQKNEPETLLDILDKSILSGVEPSQIANQTGEKLRELVILGNDNEKAILRLADDLLKVNGSSNPQTQLELAFLRYQSNFNVPKTNSESSSKKEQNSPTNKPSQSFSEKILSKTPKAIVSPEQAKTEPVDTSGMTEVDSSNWTKALSTVRSKNAPLYAVLRMCQPLQKDNSINLIFKFGFHEKRANDANNIKVIQESLDAVYGQKIELSTSVDSKIELKHQPAPKETAKNPQIENIINTFGGGEVVEL